MKRHRLASAALIAALFVGLLGCSAEPAMPDRVSDFDAMRSSEPISIPGCPVVNSVDWRAWVDASSGIDVDGTRMLHIRGEVDLPATGYRYEWRVGASDRMMPPAVHMHLEFTAAENPAATIITPEKITYFDRATSPIYRVIFIHCGDGVLAEIPSIPVAN